jgi:hypothetical protein
MFKNLGVNSEKCLSITWNIEQLFFEVLSSCEIISYPNDISISFLLLALVGILKLLPLPPTHHHFLYMEHFSSEVKISWVRKTKLSAAFAFSLASSTPL